MVVLIINITKYPDSNTHGKTTKFRDKFDHQNYHRTPEQVRGDISNKQEKYTNLLSWQKSKPNYNQCQIIKGVNILT